MAVLSLTEIIRCANSCTVTVEPAGSSWVTPLPGLSSSSRIDTGSSHATVPAATASASAPST